MKTTKIELTEKEIKLLLSILTEAEDYRSDMGCNDVNDNEEKLLSKKEKIEFIKKYLKNEYDKEDLEDMIEDGEIANWEYVTYMIKRIKEQIKK